MQKILIALLLLSALFLTTPAYASDRSQLATVLSAAFNQLISDGFNYEELYQKYLGVRRTPPVITDPADWISVKTVLPNSTLDKVLKSGVLRLGYYRHEPYYFTGKDGKDVGFEFELGNAMFKTIAAHYPKSHLKLEWVEEKIQTSGGGQDNVDAYNKLLPGLLNDKYDVIFSGIIQLPDRPVSTSTATMDFYWDVVYTGKDNWDMKSVENTNKKTLIDYLVKKKNVTIVSTQGGPSEEVAIDLTKEINAQGGSASNRTASISQLMETYDKQEDHLTVGDGIASSAVANHPDFKGLNLNIVVKGGYVIAPVTKPYP